MARKPTQLQRFIELLERHDPRIAKAFLDAVNDLRSAAELNRLAEAIAGQDLTGALGALHLDPAAYAPLEEAIRLAYSEGGASAVQSMPARAPNGTLMVIRFNIRNPRAENWLRDESSTLITRILEDQRTAVRNSLIAAMEEGRNPKTVAVDVVGRLNRATGVREGGVLGLSAPQESYARSAARELSSGDPEQLRNYLGRKLRDKRFDPTIRKALKDGKPVPREIADKATSHYRSRLLQLRGKTIGRSEALRSLQASKRQAYLQAIEEGQFSEQDVRRVWRSASDIRVRHTHAVLDRQMVGFNQPFKSPSGALLLFPGDSSLGAPGSETINCRCDVNYRVDFLANVR